MERLAVIPLIALFCAATVFASINVTIIEPSKPAIYDSIVEIKVNITSTNAVNTTLANITYPNGTYQEQTLTLLNNTTYQGEHTIPLLSGKYNITIFVNDTLGNENNTETVVLQVYSNRAPGGINDTLELWMRADKAMQNATGISYWEDETGKNNILVNGNPKINGTLNENPIAYFDGNGDYFDGETTIGFREIFLVAKPTNDGVVLSTTNYYSNSTREYWLRFISDQAFIGDADSDYIHTTETFTQDHRIYNTEMVGGVNATQSRIAVNAEEKTVQQYLASGPLNPFSAKPRIGHGTADPKHLEGNIAEIIVYNTSLNTTQRKQVNSYLAIKYGITMPINYLSSNGTLLYDVEGTHASYANDIAGITFDNLSQLQQLKTASQNTDSIITLETNTNLTSGDALLYGNDNGALIETTNDTPVEQPTRITRVWRIDKTGEVNDVNFTFNITDLNLTGTTAEEFHLLVNATTNNFTESERIQATQYANNIVTIQVLNITDNSYFTLATSNEKQVPQVTNVNVTPPNTTNLTDILTIQVTVTDNVQVHIVQANITLPNGTTEQKNLTATGNTYETNYTLQEMIGTYTIRILANDTLGNENNTETTTAELVNIAPQASNANMNNGQDITLTQATTTALIGNATITDTNGYGHITSVTGYFYQTSVGYQATNDKRNHYTTTCTINEILTSTTATYNCAMQLAHYATPTDAGSNATSDDWTFLAIATDEEGEQANDTDVVEVNTLAAFTISPTIIDFGNLDIGENTTNINELVNITNQGNVGLDILLSGTNLSCTSGEVNVTYIEYNQATFTYGFGTQLLTTDVEIDLDLLAGTETQEQPKSTTYYGFGVPPQAIGGSCTGSVVVTAQADPTND